MILCGIINFGKYDDTGTVALPFSLNERFIEKSDFLETNDYLAKL